MTLKRSILHYCTRLIPFSFFPLQELLFPSALAPGADASTTPSPSATTHAALHLRSRVTRRQPAAQRCLAEGGAKLLLSLPRDCLVPEFARAEPSMVAVCVCVCVCMRMREQSVSCQRRCKYRYHHSIK